MGLFGVVVAFIFGFVILQIKKTENLLFFIEKVYMGVLSQKCVLDYDGDHVMNDSFYKSWYVHLHNKIHINF